MDFEELKERYKMLPTWVRLLAGAFIGMLYPIYMYASEGDVLAKQLDDLKATEREARSQFEEARRKKANLPELEEQLAFTKQQLAKAREKLPPEYNTDRILEKTATYAKEAEVAFTRFDPQNEKFGKDCRKYMQMPIQGEAAGDYSQIASFLDSVAHIENSIFLNKVHLLSRVENTASNASEDMQLSDHERALKRRERLQVKSDFTLLVYREMDEAERAEQQKQQECEDEA